MNKTVSVKELRELFANGEYDIEIDTPDGYQPIVEWFDKGPMDMVEIVTENHSTRCAVNHLILTGDQAWAIADELNVGDTILTASGPELIIEKINLEEKEECYDFTVDHQNHRYYGDGIISHNSGKSYIAAGNIVKEAQAQGVYVVLIDSENALDETWLHALGVDTSEEKLLKLNMAMLDDVAKTITLFMKDMRALPDEERPKVLFVIDSLGMMMTPTEQNQFEAGDMKGDMGRKAKALKALVMNCVNMFGEYNVGLVATNHSYQSHDMFDPDDKISGGQGFIYASSIVVAIKKLKLKEDLAGTKTTTVNGIRAKCKIMKTRYAKPFEEVMIKIPYETGMDPYSGILDLLEKRELVVKQGNRLKYTTIDGDEIIEFRKNWTGDKLDIVMDEIMIRDEASPPSTFTDDDDPDDNIDDIEADVDEESME